MPETKSSSYRLSAECRGAIRQIAETLGIRDAGAIEVAVRFFLRNGLEKFLGKEIPTPKRGRPFKQKK
jgi:hypothetical protein